MARKKKQKQPDLPEMKGSGVEKVQFTDIEDAADEYVELRDKRIATGIMEKKATEKS